MGKSPDSSFVSSVSKLAFGTAAAQLLSIAAIPVTSRLFPPEAFGAMSFFLSIAAIVASMSSLKYEFAVVLPKDDDDAFHVLALGGFFTVVTAILSAIVFLFLGGVIVRKGGVPEILPVVWVFPVYIFSLGLSNLLRFWYMRMKKFGSVAAAQISGKSGHMGASIGFGLAGFTSASYLVLSATLFPLIQALIFTAGSIPSFLSFLTQRCTLAGLKKVAVEYRKFPAFTLWSDLLTASSQSLPFILIVAFFGVTANGHFSRALALVSMPLFFFGGSIRDVMYQRISAMKASGEAYSEFVEEVLTRLVTIVIPPMILLFFVSTDLFVVIAGENWLEAGIYTRYLVPWLIVWFIFSPTTSLFSIEKLQDRQLVFNIAFLILRAGTLVTCGMLNITIDMTIILYSIVGVITNSWAINYLFHKIGLSTKGLLQAAVSALLSSAPPAILTASSKWVFHMPPYAVLSIALLSYLAVLAWSSSRDPELKILLKRMLHLD